jgi:hypothetical protein
MAVADEHGELLPAYRTLDDPVRFLGVSLSGWVAIALAGGLGYGWLLLSPLGWRASVSVAVVGLGGPACLLILREQTTIGPGRLLIAVLRWRLRAPVIIAPSEQRPVRRGAVRLDHPAPALQTSRAAGQGPAPWPEPDDAETGEIA